MIKTFDYVYKKTKEITKRADALNDAYKSRDYANVNEAYANLAVECAELTNTVKKDAFSKAFDYHKVKEKLSYIYDASAEENDRITHIHLNTLLPTKKDTVRVNDKNTVELTYVAALNRAVVEKRIHPYREKVVFAIIHNFSPKSKLIDHDNFFIKPIIDGIVSVLLPDDSPDRVTLYMDARIEDEESTDIYVVPYEKFDISLIKGNERKAVAL